MTTENENTTTEKKSTPPAGAVFKHGKGGGFNLVIAGKRYVAFPAKTKKPNGPDLYIFEQAAKSQPATEGKGA